jgi:hypothetical protein
LGLILIFITSTESPVVTLTALVSLPVVGALLGFAGTAAACWLYNAHAGWSGGLWFNLEDAAAATRGAGEESEPSGPSAGQGEFDGGAQPASEKPGGKNPTPKGSWSSNPSGSTA